MSSQYPHHHDLTRSTSYNPDEINIDGITDYLSTLQTSTPYTQEQQTPFTLLQGDAPLYRSIALPEEVITEPPPQHVNKELGHVSISLDAYGQPHSHEEDYYGTVLQSPHTPTISLPVTARHHHHTSSSIFSPHTPPSFEQQASTQSLPPASPTLSTDSSSSSSVSVSYSTSHLESEYPPSSHDALMRNDSCISVSVYHSDVSTHRRDEIVEDGESELDDSDACMPDADSDELPPIDMYPRLIRQNGVYRQPSITSF